MKKLLYVLVVLVSVVALQSCESESTDEQVFIEENAEPEPKPDFQSVDPDEVEDPDDRGNE